MDAKSACAAERVRLGNGPDPYIDPLNSIQVALLGKLHRGALTEEDGEQHTMAAVLVSIN